MASKLTDTAQNVASLFHNDGLTWTTDDGLSLSDAIEEAGGRLESTSADRDERWEFSDGSAIIVSEGGWDLGFTDCSGCCCWAGLGEGHQSGCCCE